METVWSDMYITYDWAKANVALIIAVGALVIAAALTTPWVHTKDLGWSKLQPKGYNRGKRMLRKQRRDFVHNLITYEFTDVIETRVMHGELTRSEASEIYTRLKRVFPKVRDIFPSPDRLKETIKKRLGTHTQANFPDKKPRLKHMFDRVERVIL